MKPLVKRMVSAFLYIGIIVGIIACGNQMDQKITAESVTAEDSKAKTTYIDEELGISFQISHELYPSIICEIIPQEKDKNTGFEKIVASFYATVLEERQPLFHIFIYEGTFDAAYLKEKEEDFTYLGSEKGFTYALVKEEIEEITTKAEGDMELKNTLKENMEQLSIRITGVEEGIFLENEVEVGSEKTQITYTKEMKEKERIEEEITIANVESQLGYRLSYQAESFVYSEKEGKESYMGINSQGDSYPNIYFEVEKENEKTKKEIVKEELGRSGENSTKTQAAIGEETEKIAATKIAWEEGQADNRIIKETYIIQLDDNIYSIRIGYFKEAEEEYTIALQNMLQGISFIP